MTAVAKGVFRACVFCVPQAGVSAIEPIRAFLAWPDRHLKRVNERRRTGAVSAFVEAWPCV